MAKKSKPAAAVADATAQISELKKQIEELAARGGKDHSTQIEALQAQLTAALERLSALEARDGVVQLPADPPPAPRARPKKEPPPAEDVAPPQPAPKPVEDDDDGEYGSIV